MKLLLPGEFYTVFVEAGIPITIITLTLGEKGIPKECAYLGTDQIKKIRREELESSSREFGARNIVFQYPDTELSTRKDEAKYEILNTIREEKFGVIFSFDDRERTFAFDHPDHTATGEIVRFASAFADVQGIQTKSKAMDFRPQLYLWTTNQDFATHSISLSGKRMRSRESFLAVNYSSQFPASRIDEWGIIFDRISKGQNRDLLNSQEMFVRIR